MNWNTDCASLVCHRTCDCLTDPPCCIGRELVTLCVVELLDCTDKAQVSFLNQVKEEHSATGVTLCKRYNKTKVCFEQVILCALSIFNNPLELALKFLINLLCVLQSFFSKETGFNACSKFYFEFCIKKCNAANLLEVILNRVCCSTCCKNCLLWWEALDFNLNKSSLLVEEVLKLFKILEVSLVDGFGDELC